MATEGKTISCRAAVVKEVNGPYVIETVDVLPPKQGELRVKVSSAGICHSDQHAVEGAFPGYVFPSILGHEGSGVVESVGSGVKDIVPGDGVVFLFEGYCGECNSCRNPKTNRCDQQPRDHLMIDGTARVMLAGDPVTQFTSVGCFCEYVVVAEMNVVKVNPKAPLNRLALASCCIPTGYGSAINCAKVTPGSTCAIWGLGGVGMNVVLGCRDSKASKIIGIDINPKKFPLAKELGCTDVLNPSQQTKPVPEVLAEMTNGGPDYCFVSVGILSVMEEAFNSSHPLWGETIVIGITDFGKKIQVGVWELLFGRVVKGSLYGSYKAKLAIPGLVDKIVDGQIPLEKLVSHVYPLDKINEAYDLLKTGESVRTVIDFELKP